jgi:hypothetical protein
MLPSEKSEKWVRRLAWAAFIFVVLYTHQRVYREGGSSAA